MAFDDDAFRQLLGFLAQQPERLAELRGLLLADALQALPVQLSRQLAEAQARTEQNLASLTARVDQLAERMGELTAQVDHLAEAQGRTEAALRELIGWQKGEQQRRAGERYEQDILRESFTLFAGGDGGSPVEPHVRARLRAVLADIVASDEMMVAQANPTLADVIWWKDGQFALAEVSLVVDLSDVHRAAERAETLRKAGSGRGVETVLPVVIGGHWSGREVREEARRLGVVWWMREGKDVSPELVAYRRLRASAA